MTPDWTRRNFLRATTAGSTLLGLEGLAQFTGLPPVSAAETNLDPKLVRLDPEIEPLVRLLEETSRDRLLEEVAARIKKGLGYRDLLAALLLAGIRNVQPRPSVGFKFHAVLVVHSAHLASQAAPDRERWLPLFWALDNFKSSQAETVKTSGWRMSPVEEAKVPPARKARQAFVDAMDRWDESAADAAVAGLVRTAGAAEVYELFNRYGARDLRDIGHKAIYVSQSWRALQCVGWQHAEPVLRSLAYALLAHNKNEDPIKGDLPVDRPGRRNLEVAARVNNNWLENDKDDPAATTDLLAALRQASTAEISDKVVDLLNKGYRAQTVWDALHVGAGELLSRQPGILGLHTLTLTNAIHYAFGATGNDETRRWLLLQNAAFLTHIREDMNHRGKPLNDIRLDTLDPAPLDGKTDAAAEILADVSRNRDLAARKALSYARGKNDPQAFFDAARLLVFFKGSDSHDYKFSSAVFEDYFRVSPVWRDRFLAASVYNLRGSGGPDTALVKRAHAALGG
ncbi:hypothetical protein [Fimbriiglobus ruber]|uniref:Twin-arginine translocation signal domain-containing protein n=1 Tax=Fimbriiglobus ruber TaxID=1908690 RepID=A0A225DG85_9BACT|nr:hypothetical protein [Fimbriiglobus ruber]OWK35107.1 hypothetical protein FRUB_09949 [Fimbriiglobus ruber]